MKLGKKILIVCLAVVLLAVTEYVLFYIFHYVKFDDYEDSIATYTVEDGKDYSPLQKGAKDDFDLIAKDSSVELYADTNTGYVAVHDLATDAWYYSTPEDIDNDTVANETNKDKLKSQLVVTYFNSARREGTFTSYRQCVAVDPKAQLMYESIDNGIRFNYVLKNKATAFQQIPIIISAERYEEFTSKMSAKTAKNLTNFYFLTDDEESYEMKEDMRDGTATARVYSTIYKAFREEAGYTDEDYAIDMEDTNYDIELPACFNISVEYRIVDGKLVVNIPTSMIKEINATIYSIELLPGFAYATSEDNGYFVVPNGSGSIINFNNGSRVQYSTYVYGIDNVAADYTKVENAEIARLPLYAICKDKTSVLAEVERGASLAQISTQTAKGIVSISSYNTADYTFIIRGREKLAMFGTAGSGADIPIIEKNFADVNIQVAYSFLGEEYKGYSGVANYYRQKLIDAGKLTALGDENAKSDIGFYYDLIGAAKTTDFILGVQYLAVEPMTTYAQAKEIAENLNAAGISNQIVNYQGWFNGGYYHDVTDRFKLVRKLGSKKSLEEFASYVEGLGGKVYGDVAFQQVSDISKRYVPTYEAARYYAGYSVELGQVHPTTLRQTASLGYRETLFTIVSPKFLVRYVDKFIDKTEDIDITGYSLRDLGDVLSSDKKRTEVINREAALDVVNDQIKKFADHDKQLMISGGNDYAAIYADDIINAPIGHNEYYSVDDEIPFYEMVYHGYTNYASYNINLSDTYDVDSISLRLIEYGCSPHFVYTYDEASKLKYTGLNKYYSSTFDIWKDTSVEIYNRVNEALKNVKNASIVNHTIVEEGVRKVEYSNGVTIIVNTTDSDVTVDGINVAAMNYVMEGVN